MSEEILNKESEEMTEEELAEKRRAAAEQDSSDEEVEYIIRLDEEVLLLEEEGALLLLEEKDLLEMDRFEGVADGHYSRDSIEVMMKPEGLCRVVTYIAQKTGPEIPPTRAYLDHLLAGRGLLSPKYLKNLEKLQTFD